MRDVHSKAGHATVCQQQTWYSVHHIVLPVRMPPYIVGVTITGTANPYAADSIHSYSVETKPAFDVHP